MSVRLPAKGHIFLAVLIGVSEICLYILGYAASETYGFWAGALAIGATYAFIYLALVAIHQSEK